MGDYNVSHACLFYLMRDEKIDAPILQVLGLKEVVNTSGDVLYRMILNDGSYYITYGLVATLDEKISKYSIVQLKTYHTDVFQNAKGKIIKKALFIKEIDVLHEGNEVGRTIGDPLRLSDFDIAIINTFNCGTNSELKCDIASNGEKINNTETDVSASVCNIASIVNEDNDDSPPAKRPATMAAVQANKTLSNNKQLNLDDICPIASLRRYASSWVLEVLVANKSDLKQYSTLRGSGSLFSMELRDKSGAIKCTAFEDLAKKYHSIIKMNKAYYISKCQVRIANKRFSSFNNDYELIITNNSVFEECNDNVNISLPSNYNFIPLNQIGSKIEGSFVDVIGVCRGASEKQEFLTKHNGVMNKKEIYLLDQSNHEICLTLWGENADYFCPDESNPVVAIREAKVNNYMEGLQLTTSGTSIQINPNIPLTSELRKWYDSRDKDASTNNLSSRIEIDISTYYMPWRSFEGICDLHEQRLLPRGGYFQLFGYVGSLRDDNKIFYEACPQKDCNKKVTLLNKNGMYKCNRCDKEIKNFKFQLYTSVKIIVSTGEFWVTMFNDVAEKVFNATAQEIGNASINSNVENQNYFKRIMDGFKYRQGHFKLQARSGKLNDQKKLDIIMVDFKPLKPEDNVQLITQISDLTGLRIFNHI